MKKLMVLGVILVSGCSIDRMETAKASYQACLKEKGVAGCAAEREIYDSELADIAARAKLAAALN